MENESEKQAENIDNSTEELLLSNDIKSVYCHKCNGLTVIQGVDGEFRICECQQTVL